MYNVGRVHKVQNGNYEVATVRTVRIVWIILLGAGLKLFFLLVNVLFKSVVGAEHDNRTETDVEGEETLGHGCIPNPRL